MVTSNFTVCGMTGEHCIRLVTEEVSELMGVTAVRVDLACGRIAVDSAAPMDVAQVQIAIQMAGFTLATV